MLVLAAGRGAVGAAAQHPDLGPYQLSGRGPDGLSGLGAGLQEAGMRRPRPDPADAPGDGLSVIVEPSGVSHDDAAA